MNFYTSVDISGDWILIRGFEDGKRVKRKEKFSPCLYTPAGSRNPKSKTIFQNLEGNPLEKISFDTIGESREFIDNYNGVSNFDLYGNTDYVCQFIGKNYPDVVEYDESRIKVVNIDIETTCENGFPTAHNPIEEINVLTVYVDGFYHVFTYQDFIPKTKDTVLHQAYDEKEMLSEFLDFWEKEAPDVITGWNIRFFDIPYLFNRIQMLLDEKEAKRLSPWGRVREREVSRMGKKETVYKIIGVSCLDYFELYRTFTYKNQESYSLDHISFVELGERKHSYGEFETMSDFYKGDFQKFVEYNIQDVRLVQKLEEKMHLLELSFALSYSAKVNHEDIFSQVRTWDSIIYHHLLSKNTIIPMKRARSTIVDEQYAGAFVKEPIVGEHDWVVSFDLNSLYPHLIRQYNISPETLVEINEDSRFGIGPNNILRGPEDFYGKECYEKLNKLKEKGYSVAANGTAYRKDVEGFLPELMRKMYLERKKYKKLMIDAERKKEKNPNDKSLDFEISKYNNFQLVRKIQLNSAYGAIGNIYFRFYSRDMAEAITLSGQLSIRWIMDKLNEFLNQQLKTEGYDYIVASDTDSVYLRMGNLVKKVLPNETDRDKIINFLDKSCEKIIQPFVDQKYQELSEKMNAFSNEMKMGREVIADKGIWTAKKRYMLNVYDSEGVRYKTPKMKIMGIETTRSSTPHVVREKLKKAISIILREDNDTLVNFIEEFKEEFMKLPPEEVSFPRGCNGLLKYMDEKNVYSKGTPIAVKGALIYNNLLAKHNLQRKYKKILEGDKIRFLYLKQPNPLREKVLSFPVELPKEFGLHSYFDYELQFEKSFIDPLNSIVEKIGWRMDSEQTLESLFV